MASLWANVCGLVAKASDAIDTLESKSYRNEKLQMQKEAVYLQLTAVTGTVIGAVTLFFGITKTHFSLVMIGGSLTYVCYNMYRVGENYAEVAKNPNDYDVYKGWNVVTNKKKPDNAKLQKTIEKNTFYFGVFVKFIVNHVINLR